MTTPRIEVQGCTASFSKWMLCVCLLSAYSGVATPAYQGIPCDIVGRRNGTHRTTNLSEARMLILVSRSQTASTLHFFADWRHRSGGRVWHITISFSAQTILDSWGMIIDDVMTVNIIIIYKSCTLQRSAWRNMAGSRSKQRTVRYEDA